MWTKKFWSDALERAVKTFAQSILTILTLGGIQVLANPASALEEIKEFGWIIILLGGALGFIYSILTSIVSSFSGEKDSASFIK